MGIGFTYYCKNCGKDYYVAPGVGMGYPSLCDETLAAVKAGKYGEKLKAAAESEKHVGCAAERKIYVCEDCGCWDELIDASVYGWANKKKDREIPYVAPWCDEKKDYRLIEQYVPTCGKCGGAMHAIDIDEDSGATPALTCNHCGAPLIPDLMVTRWD